MAAKPKRTLYVYVDESGMETGGAFFVVGIVLTGNPYQVANNLEAIETLSQKGIKKWRKANWHYRQDYIERIGKLDLLKGSIYREVHRSGKNFQELTADTVAAASQTKKGHTKLIVYVDALRKREIHAFKRYLKPSFRKTKVVVRGVRKDENNALIRLADALCGVVSDADRGHEWSVKALARLKRRGVLL